MHFLILAPPARAGAGANPAPAPGRGPPPGRANGGPTAPTAGPTAPTQGFWRAHQESGPGGPNFKPGHRETRTFRAKGWVRLHPLTWKLIGAYTIMAFGLTQLIWGLVVHRRRRSMPPAFFAFTAALQALIAVQLSVGAYLYWRGYPLPGQHLFYGVLVGLGGAASLALRPGTATGQRYRGKPLVHAVLGLFILAVALRSWMTA